MAFVDPERFKRFEQFLTRHIRAVAEAAGRAFEAKGPGVLIYHAPDDRFDTPVTQFKFQYKTKAEIDRVHAETRDELLQGMLDRYQPPGEAVFVALYQDNTYDISRLVLRPPKLRRRRRTDPQMACTVDRKPRGAQAADFPCHTPRRRSVCSSE